MPLEYLVGAGVVLRYLEGRRVGILGGHLLEDGYVGPVGQHERGRRAGVRVDKSYRAPGD